MIPITPKPQPPHFDTKVRQPGLKWIEEQGIDITQPLPKGITLKPCWRECLDELYYAYGGVCAYVCLYIPRTTGARSVDHFVAKSSTLGQAYEWDNYRLACSKMNTRKNVFDDVLDPFFLQPGTFQLNLFTGAILPTASEGTAERELAQRTINRLGLDDPDCRHDRTRAFDDFLRNRDDAQLRRDAPFVWQEVLRQGLL